jgi:hypothetical protein
MHKHLTHLLAGRVCRKRRIRREFWTHESGDSSGRAACPENVLFCVEGQGCRIEGGGTGGGGGGGGGFCVQGFLGELKLVPVGEGRGGGGGNLAPVVHCQGEVKVRARVRMRVRVRVRMRGWSRWEWKVVHACGEEHESRLLINQSID